MSVLDAPDVALGDQLDECRLGAAAWLEQPVGELGAFAELGDLNAIVPAERAPSSRRGVHMTPAGRRTSAVLVPVADLLARLAAVWRPNDEGFTIWRSERHGQEQLFLRRRRRSGRYPTWFGTRSCCASTPSARRSGS